MVEAVSSTQTIQNNENSKTNVGKMVGAGAGVAWGGYNTYRNIKVIKEMDTFLDSNTGKKISDCKNLDALKKFFNESTLSAGAKKRQLDGIKILEAFKFEQNKGSVKDYIDKIKQVKKPTAAMIVIGLAFVGAIGLGIGAIVDGIINRNKD